MMGETLANNSSAYKAKLIQLQLDQTLDLSRTVNICRHAFADGIVDVYFSAETVRLAFDFRQHLDDSLTMHLCQAKNQLRLCSQLGRQVSRCMWLHRHIQGAQHLCCLVCERCAGPRRHSRAHRTHVDSLE